MAEATAKIGESATKTAKEATAAGGVLKTALGTALGFAGAQAGIAALSGAFRALGGAVVGTNATLETATLQYETLLQSADAARERVKELFEFAAKTPFETGPIIQADKLLTTFGARTTENLTKVGDAAAAMNLQIDEVAFWFGRAYTAIQSGRPFGESAARLQEMGILSGEARNRLEALQESGASSTQVWNEFTKSFDRFDGAMLRQSRTFAGLTSTIKDNVNLLAAAIGRPFFERIVKPGLGRLADLLSTGTVERGAARMAAGVDRAITLIGRGLKFLADTLRDLIGDPIVFFTDGLRLPLPLATALSRAIVFLRDDLDDLARGLLTLARYLLLVARDGDTLNDFLADLPPAARPVARMLGILIELGKEIVKSLVTIANAGVKVVTFLADLAAKLGLTNKDAGNITASLSKLEAILPTLGALIAGLITFQVLRSMGEFVLQTAQLAKTIVTFPLEVLRGMVGAVTDFGAAAFKATSQVAGFLSKLLDLAAATGRGLGTAAGAVTQTITQVVSRSAEAAKALGEDIADRTQRITQVVVSTAKVGGEKGAAGVETGVSFGKGLAQGIGIGFGTAAPAIARAVVGALAAAAGIVAAVLGIPVWAVVGIAIAIAIAAGLIFKFRKEILAGLISVFKSLPEILGTALGALAAGLVLLLVAPFAGLYLLLKEAIIPATKAFIEFGSDAVSAVADALGDVAGAVGDGLGDVAGAVGRALSSIPGAVAAALSAIPGIVSGLITEFFRSEVEGWKRILSGDFVGGLDEIFLGVPSAIIGFLSDLPRLVGELFSSLADKAGEAASSIGDFFSKLPGRFTEIFGQVLATVTGFIGGVSSAVSEWTIVQQITEILNRVWEAARDTFITILKTVSDALGIDVPKEFNKLLDFVTGLADKFLAAGASLGANIYLGIEQGISGIGTVVKAALNTVLDSLEKAINAAIDAYNKVADLPLNPLPHAGHLSLPRLARGVRDFAGGLAMVGEEGRELMLLPRGSSVFANRDTERILSGLAALQPAVAVGGGGAPSVNMAPQFTLQGATLEELRAETMRAVDTFFRQLGIQSSHGGAPLAQGIG